MTFEELLNIANTHIDFQDGTLPLSSYDIASKQLNLLVKNSLQCKIDYKTADNPLASNEAIYCVFKGEYTIYYDENHPYKNFFVAHEISHHLLDHQTDDINKHHDANLLGAIIVAPPHLIKKNQITNSMMLSEQCKIPIDTANIYWNEYVNNYLKKQDDIRSNRLKRSLFSVISAVLSFSIGFTAAFIIFPKTSNKPPLEGIIFSTEATTNITKTAVEIPSETRSEILTEITTENNIITAQEQVFITKTGEKYHI